MLRHVVPSVQSATVAKIASLYVRSRKPLPLLNQITPSVGVQSHHRTHILSRTPTATPPPSSSRATTSHIAHAMATVVWGSEEKQKIEMEEGSTYTRFCV